MAKLYYCSHCGATNVAGMKYCKQCGEQIGPATSPTGAYQTAYDPRGGMGPQSGRSSRAVAALAWAMAAVSVGGLSIILGTAIPLFGVGFGGHDLSMIILAGIALLGGTVFLLGRQMSRLISLQIGESQSSAAQRSLPAAYPPPQMQTGPVGIPSVTEGTTKIFDPSTSTQE
ncbi:MAG TPA: zinc ribbon domain-containing protein [Blastocatellia bacterium]